MTVHGAHASAPCAGTHLWGPAVVAAGLVLVTRVGRGNATGQRMKLLIPRERWKRVPAPEKINCSF